MKEGRKEAMVVGLITGLLVWIMLMSAIALMSVPYADVKWLAASVFVASGLALIAIIRKGVAR